MKHFLLVNVARQMMEQQQQMQAHMERERRSSNSGTSDRLNHKWLCPYCCHSDTPGVCWCRLVKQGCICFLPLQVLLSKDTPLCSLWPPQSYLLPWTWVVLLPLHPHRDLLLLRRGHPSLLSPLHFPWVERATGTSPPPKRAWQQWSPEPNFAVFRGWDARLIYLFKEDLNSSGQKYDRQLRVILDRLLYISARWQFFKQQKWS